MTINGALNGATLKPVSRYGDLQNKISIGSAAVFLSKDRFKENNPYSKVYDTEGSLTIYMNLHFLAEARRQLAGNEEAGTSTFSPEELKFWNEFLEYQNDILKYGELVIALEAFDDWLIDELMGTSHPELDRDYATTHKWRYTEERNQEKGISWI